MTDAACDPARNAAIWYSSDAYDPESRGINGRRVAGATFLKAFFKYGELDDFVSFGLHASAGALFAEQGQRAGTTKPCRHVSFLEPKKLAPVGTVFYGAPTMANELWRRYPNGSGEYSLCGILHTIATAGAMRGILETRLGPQEPWDGMICTSTAVKAAYERQLDVIDDMLNARFGSAPPRPVAPVIPLGIDTDEFAHDAKAREEMRAEMGWGESDVVICTLARLSAHSKFDPFPFFIALERAQERLGDSVRLHFLACGYHSDGHSAAVYKAGADEILKTVSYTHLDGREPANRTRALSAGDVFAFPVDNIQETFGMSPIEAMAAGLPVLTTDWNGMKDTVTPDVGIRVPTRMLGDYHSLPETRRYLVELTTSTVYHANVAASIEIDMPQMIDAIVALAENADLRKRMGAAGLERARTVYDWRNIIPTYQDFWAELSAIRQANREPPYTKPRLNPMLPYPTWQYSGYPTERIIDGIGPCVAQPDRLTATEMLKLRRLDRMGAQPFESADRLETVLDAVKAAGEDGASSRAVAEATGAPPVAVDRCFMWLLKYDLIARKA